MTSDRTRTRARLASALDEAADIEVRAIDEVRAALMEQGIDPTASIRLAQKLSLGGNAGDPAARLLQQIERSEALDAEIAALEEADIDDVRAALPQRHPGGASEAEATSIEASGKFRRRLPMLGWGGSLVGIAASVLLFIAVRPDQLDQVEAPLPAIEAETPVAADAESIDALSEDALSAGTRAPTANRHPSPPRLEITVDQNESASALAPEASLAPVIAKAEPPVNPPRPAPPSASAGSVASVPGRGGDVEALLPIISDLMAILLVDEAKASAALRALAKRLPEGQLAAKFGEAELRAYGAKVVALVAFARDGERVEAVLVEKTAIPSVRVDDVTALNDSYAPTPSGPQASFELVELWAPD